MVQYCMMMRWGNCWGDGDADQIIGWFLVITNLTWPHEQTSVMTFESSSWVRVFEPDLLSASCCRWLLASSASSTVCLASTAATRRWRACWWCTWRCPPWCWPSWWWGEWWPMCSDTRYSSTWSLSWCLTWGGMTRRTVTMWWPGAGTGHRLCSSAVASRQSRSVSTVSSRCVPYLLSQVEHAWQIWKYNPAVNVEVGQEIIVPRSCCRDDSETCNTSSGVIVDRIWTDDCYHKVQIMIDDCQWLSCCRVLSSCRCTASSWAVSLSLLQSAWWVTMIMSQYWDHTRTHK